MTPYPIGYTGRLMGWTPTMWEEPQPRDFLNNCICFSVIAYNVISSNGNNWGL